MFEQWKKTKSKPPKECPKCSSALKERINGADYFVFISVQKRRVHVVADFDISLDKDTFVNLLNYANRYITGSPIPEGGLYI